jgi:CRISPR/Cas system CMR-associated protein Cmr5 small subunit
MPITRAQTWSSVAFTSVRTVADGTIKVDQRNYKSKYKTSCNKMPGLIHQSGALQALVFQVARDKAGGLYVDHLARAYFTDQPENGGERLIRHAQDLDLTPYMAFTRDLADIAQWFRRFSQIELAETEDAEA